jgi:hypothetical protein
MKPFMIEADLGMPTVAFPHQSSFFAPANGITLLKTTQCVVLPVISVQIPQLFKQTAI